MDRICVIMFWVHKIRVLFEQKFRMVGIFQAKPDQIWENSWLDFFFFWKWVTNHWLLWTINGTSTYHTVYICTYFSTSTNVLCTSTTTHFFSNDDTNVVPLVNLKQRDEGQSTIPSILVYYVYYVECTMILSLVDLTISLGCKIHNMYHIGSIGYNVAPPVNLTDKGCG